jgi:drug/metabolite transporter (DMT)-like permease
MPDTRPPLRAFVLAFTTIYLVWGSTYLAIRVGVESMPPFAMAALRFFIAGVVLMAFLKLRGAVWPTARQWRDAFISGFFLLLGGNGLVSWAEQSVPSGITALIIGASPLFIVLADWAWPGGRRPGAVTLGAMLLGFAGVAWLAAPWQHAAPDHLNSAGVAVILLSCVSWSVGAIFGRHVRDPAPPFVAAAAQMLAGSGWLALAAWAHGDIAAWHTTTITTRSWLAFAYLVIAGCLGGYTAFVWLLKHATPARTATYAYVNPVVAVFLGWLLLAEPVNARTLSASVIILAAVVIISTQGQRSSKKSGAA